jgi:type I restriction enzyme M protein
LGLEDARLLVTRPAEDKLVFTDTARDRIVELCARQPFLIQLLCNHIFEAAAESSQRAVSEAAVADAASAMAMDCEQFETLWRDFIGSERRKYILGRCVALQSLPDPITLRLLEVKLEEARIVVPRKQDLGDDLAHLRELELLTMDDQGAAYRIAIPLMVDWIRKNHDLEDLRRRAAEESEKQQA